MNDVFRALADPTRRAILQKLRNGPMSSGSIAQEFDSTWATVSRHLSVLTAADLVTPRRNGQHVLYELNTTVFQQFLAQVMQWTNSPARDDNA
jgi:DNA-binding transcriptional ArsR family regulator